MTSFVLPWNENFPVLRVEEQEKKSNANLQWKTVARPCSSCSSHFNNRAHDYAFLRRGRIKLYSRALATKRFFGKTFITGERVHASASTTVSEKLLQITLVLVQCLLVFSALLATAVNKWWQAPPFCFCRMLERNFLATGAKEKKQMKNFGSY